MFSGIVEDLGTITDLKVSKGNLQIRIKCNFFDECYIDQSIAHNGVCLTIDELNAEDYRVTAIQETLSKTNLGSLKKGDFINLERSMTMENRLDGHLVQGHVDCTVRCLKIKELEGSWVFRFEYPFEYRHWIVKKGSISVDGVSLTVAELNANYFEVAIIPYTFQNTRFQRIEIGDKSNIEFDIIGKYVARHMQVYNEK